MNLVVATLQTAALVWLVCLAATLIFAVLGFMIEVYDERTNEDRESDAGIQESETEKWERTDGY